MADLQATVTIHLDQPDGIREALEIPARVGSVKIGEVLGQGAGGIVLLGFDEILGRRVAVKFLHRSGSGLSAAATAELVDGLRAAARVKHPNVVTVHSVEVVAQMATIVMEFVDGISLREYLARSGAVAPEIATFILRRLASAVESLHEAGVVHRDLKPANILFDRTGEPRVCDFGLAIDAAQRRGERAHQPIAGSPLYMAPEMFEGHVSPQSDVYALGVLYYEMLAGVAPHSAESMSEIRRCHESMEPSLERLPPLPEALIDLVQRCLHKQRFLRFKTAGHLRRALDDESTSRDDAIRMRISSVIHAAPDAPRPSAADSTPAMTTFDLLSQRARDKRTQRGD